MRDPKTHPALSVYKGAATIHWLAPRGMITLRGDLRSAPLQKAVRDACGFDVPAQNRCALEGERGVAWMSPDELLVMVPRSHVDRTVDQLTQALDGQFALVADVSCVRALFEITGPNARDVLAKLMPADLSASAFSQGMIRRTRLAQVAAAIWMNGQAIEMVCVRSVADYTFGLLSNAAAPSSEVGFL